MQIYGNTPLMRPILQMLKGQLYDTREFNEAAHDVIKVRVNPEHGEKDGKLAAQYKLNKYPTTWVIEKIGAKPRKLDIFKKYFGKMKIEPLEHVIWNMKNDPRTVTPPPKDEEGKEDGKE